MFGQDRLSKKSQTAVLARCDDSGILLCPHANAGQQRTSWASSLHGGAEV